MVTVKELGASTRPKIIKNLQKIWRKHGFELPMPEGKALAKELMNRLGIKQVPGRKIGLCVIAHEHGYVLEPHNNQKKPPNFKTKTKVSSRRVATPSKDEKSVFYASWEWRTLRKKVLNEFGAKCQCCGATPDHTDMAGKPVKIVVDHIKPLHHYWNLRLTRSNLQVLCDECNQGAGAWDETDHRPKPAPDEWIIEDEPSDLIADQLRIHH